MGRRSAYWRWAIVYWTAFRLMDNGRFAIGYWLLDIGYRRWDGFAYWTAFRLWDMGYWRLAIGRPEGLLDASLLAIGYRI